MTVPMFSGLKPFRLTDYPKLTPDYYELSVGDFALVVFTVGSYKLKDRPHMCSLNVQFVICLTEHDPRES